MCGRFSISTPLEELRERFDVTIPESLYKPRYNAAPSQDMLVIPEEMPHEADLFHWGLIPHWAKDPKIGNHLINARAETVAEKPVFRTPFKKHRCLVLSDGFYEWDKKSTKHVPYRLILKGQEPFAFAGICDYWKDEKGKEIKSFSIITTKANSLISKIHDRMPVILPQESEAKWLDPELDLKKAEKLLKSYPAKGMDMYTISTLINNPKNDVSQVLEPAY
jgi:putative SOS response-associated peptidase YedK